MDMMQVFHNTHATGGDTVSMDDHRPLSGYVVSIYPEYERRIPRKGFTVYNIMEYVCEHIEILKRDEHYLGTWVHDDQVYLDISVRTQDFLHATMEALDANQLAIYDILGKETVYLNDIFMREV